jgi:hypothetical protein
VSSSAPKPRRPHAAGTRAWPAARTFLANSIASLLPMGLLALPAPQVPASAAPQGAPSAKGETTYNVTYTPGTVVLGPALVTKVLKNVSADGATYTFDGSVPGLKALRPGNILLIGGKALRRVTSVNTTGTETVVHTGSANLLQAIKNGEIGWDINFPSDVATGPGIRVNVGGGLRLVSPGLGPHPRLGMTASCLGCPSGPGTIDYQGTVSGFDVNLRFDESSFAGLVMDLSAKKKDGSMLLKAEAHLHQLNDVDDILIRDSQLKSFEYREGGLTGDTTLEWHVATTASVPQIEQKVALRIPVSFSVPFWVGPVPVVLAVKASLAAYPAIAEQGASGGKVEVEYNSALDITGGGSGVYASGSFGKVQFRVTGETVTAGFAPATGFGMDVEFPRVEVYIFGTGLLFGSVLAHVAGYFTPGTILKYKGKTIPPCQKVSGDAALYVGAAFSLFGLNNVTLFKKAYESQQWEAHKPGTCGDSTVSAQG